MYFRDNVIIVTGDASGLGAATASLIVAEGGKVVIANLNPEAGRALEQELGGKARYVPADITREEDGNAVIAAGAALGDLRGLVNCAGISIAEKVLGRDGPHSLASFSRLIEVNVVGSFNMLRLLRPPWPRPNQARMASVASSSTRPRSLPLSLAVQN